MYGLRSGGIDVEPVDYPGPCPKRFRFKGRGERNTRAGDGPIGPQQALGRPCATADAAFHFAIA